MNDHADKNPSNALADSISGFDDPSMGDEREHGVILRAYTFGSIVSTYVLLALTVLFAVIGAGFWTVPLALAAGVTTVAASAYSRRAGVDFSLALARAEPKRLLKGFVLSAVVIAAWLFAVVYHQSTGLPLIEAGLGSMPRSSTSVSLTIGAVIGVLAALAVFLVSRRKALKRARIEAQAADEINDEN